MARPISKEQRAKILEGISSGKEAKDVAEQVGVCMGTVYRVMRKKRTRTIVKMANGGSSYVPVEPRDAAGSSEVIRLRERVRKLEGAILDLIIKM